MPPQPSGAPQLGATAAQFGVQHVVPQLIKWPHPSSTRPQAPDGHFFGVQQVLERPMSAQVPLQHCVAFRQRAPSCRQVAVLRACPTAGSATTTTSAIQSIFMIVLLDSRSWLATAVPPRRLPCRRFAERDSWPTCRRVTDGPRRDLCWFCRTVRGIVAIDIHTIFKDVTGPLGGGPSSGSTSVTLPDAASLGGRGKCALCARTPSATWNGVLWPAPCTRRTRAPYGACGEA
jgi:hypothetical protein